jgi:hypothetical protein
MMGCGLKPVFPRPPMQGRGFVGGSIEGDGVSMKTYPRIVLIFVTCILCFTGVFAQETSWRELNIELAKLVQQGRYPDAVEVAERALEVAEETFGGDHPKVAVSLNNLATLCRIQGTFAEAESLLRVDSATIP